MPKGIHRPTPSYSYRTILLAEKSADQLAKKADRYCQIFYERVSNSKRKPRIASRPDFADTVCKIANARILQPDSVFGFSNSAKAISVAVGLQITCPL